MNQSALVSKTDSRYVSRKTVPPCACTGTCRSCLTDIIPATFFFFFISCRLLSPRASLSFGMLAFIKGLLAYLLLVAHGSVVIWKMIGLMDSQMPTLFLLLEFLPGMQGCKGQGGVTMLGLDRAPPIVYFG